MNQSGVDAVLAAILQGATDEELDLIVACLKRKLTQRLTSSQPYLRYHAAVDKAPFKRAYVERVMASISHLGGHGVANLVRGFQGPPYERILRRTAKRLHLKYAKTSSVESLELAILGTEMARAWRRLNGRQRDAWMMHQLIHWTQDAGISTEQLSLMSAYFDAQPRRLPIDDLLDGLQQYCIRELPAGEELYLQLIHRVFSCVLIRLTPQGLQMELCPYPQQSRGLVYTLFDLMGDSVPRTINSPSLMGMFRLWMRSPASPMPTSSHDPNSGLWRIMANVMHLQPQALLNGALVLPLMPTLVAAAAGTALAIASSPSDRVLRPVIVAIACIRLRQLRS
ncbi:MAG: hypothetical protein R3Y56_07630 [Akkermansia sp.]